MNPITRDILKKIAAKVNLAAQLHTTTDVPISKARFSEYHECLVSNRLEVHDELRELEKEGWLKLTFEKASFGSVERIKRIAILDATALLKELGVEALADQIVLAVSKLAAGTNGLDVPDDYGNVCANAESFWGQGKLYFNCRPNDVSNLINAFKIVSWITKSNGQQQIDYRTLSSQLLETSKALEHNISLIERLLAIVAPSEAPREKSGDLLAYYSISRFPPSFRFKGSVTVTTPKGELETGSAWPFLEIPPDGTSFINADSKETSYVLFIENKSSFERHCREIDDNGLIIYTNGFPSSSWQRLIKQLAKGLPTETPVFHWGDIDPGGYRIFQFIARLTERDVHPHQMDQFINHRGLGKGIVVADLLNELNKHEHKGSLSLINALNQFEPNEALYWVEQEEQTPKSPI